MECVLHVGMHKTGTSAIQQALQGYDDGETFFADLGDANHSHPVQTLFTADNLRGYWSRVGMSDSGIDQKIAKIQEQFTSSLTRHGRKKVLFSGENISILRTECLERLRSAILEHCDSIEIVIFARNPYEEIASSFQEAVKHGSTTNPKDFRVSEPFEARYKRLSSVFGEERISVRFYEDRSKCGGDIVRYFFDLEGLDYNQANLSNPRANTSVSLQALQLLYRFNITNPVNQQGFILSKARWRLVASLSEIIKKKTKISKEPLSVAVDRSTIELLNERFGRQYCAGDEASRQDAEEWIADIDQDAIDDVVSFLNKKGFGCRSKDDATVVVNTLYYFHVANVFLEFGKPDNSDGAIAALDKASAKRDQAVAALDKASAERDQLVAEMRRARRDPILHLLSAYRRKIAASMRKWSRKK